MKTITREVVMCNLDLLGTEPKDDNTVLSGNGNANNQVGTGFFVHKRIISAVKKIKFISDRMLYVT
jgi:hypothetical protein